ncbi:hypothetical protein BH10BAC5_BH10BAC5_07480 [soil metagenome]
MKKIIFTVFLCLCAFYRVNAQFKLDENFSSLTFPPTGWSVGPGVDDSGNPVSTRSNSNGYALSGTGSAFIYFYNWTSGTDSLSSPVFTAAGANDTLYFDHAYRTYTSEVDDMKIYTSLNGGATWTLLQDLPGGTVVGTGMVTAAPSTTNYTAPSAGQWLSKKYAVPSGVNRVKFEFTTAYGNNLFLDNIKVGSPPSIDVAVTSVGQTGSVFVTTASGSVTPTGTVKNNGGAPATFTVTRKITPGGYTDTQNITSLASNTTQNVNFTNFNYNAGTLYTVKDSVFIAGDVNQANDTLTGFVTYSLPKTTFILNADNRSRDSMVAHLNALGLNNTYDQGTSYPGIGLANWRTIIVLIGSTGTWSAGLRDSMKAYLDGANDAVNKRSMLIFGNDLGYNNDPRRNVTAAPEDTTFYRQYLHAQYWSDAWTTNYTASDSTIKGMTGFTSITAQRVNDPFPDGVAPAYWSAGVGNGTVYSAFIPVTESGNGDTCTAVAFEGQYYNVFYGTNVYYGYTATPTGLTSPQGSFLNAIWNFLTNDGGVLPVELASFTAVTENRNVTLKWSTSAEQNNAGFDIERKTSASQSWSKIGNVIGSGISGSIKNYSFKDNNINTGRYNYRLKQIDFNGNYRYYDLSNEVIVGVPIRFNLSQNYPNPFNPATKINYDLPFDSKVSIVLFDITGRQVAELLNTSQVAGYQTVTFNASNLSSGTYFYQLNVNSSNGQSFNKTLKMMLVK